MDFSWLSDLFNAVLSFIPRPVVIRATHGGVCWRFGYKVIEMKPGWRWWWPLISDIEIIPVARQTNNIPSQALVTKDKKQVVAGAMLIFSIKDIMQAIGQRNWDVGTTVNDIAAAAVVKVITKWTLDDLITNITDAVEEELTAVCQKQLRQFGVYVHRCCLTDFAPCRIYKIMGTNPVEAVGE